MPGEAQNGVASVGGHGDGSASAVAVHKKGPDSEESKQALIAATATLPFRSYASLRTVVGCALDGFEW